MNNAKYFYGLALTLTATVFGSALAADLPKEGTYDVQVCMTQTMTRIVMPDIYAAKSYDETGTAISTSPGGMFDGDTMHCLGTFGGHSGTHWGIAFCEGVATDGSKRLTRFQSQSDGTLVRDEIFGTGKYEGLQTTGSVRQVGASQEIKPGTVRYCNQLTGTYRVK